MRGDSISHIDLTLVTDNLLRKVSNWKILEDDGLTLHKFIAFQRAARATKNNAEKIITSFEPEKFRKELLAQDLKGTMTPSRLCKSIYKAQRAATVTERGEPNHVPYWWTEEVANARKRAVMSRRNLTRARSKGYPEENIQTLEESMKKARKELKKHISAAKKK